MKCSFSLYTYYHTKYQAVKLQRSIRTSLHLTFVSPNFFLKHSYCWAWWCMPINCSIGEGGRLWVFLGCSFSWKEKKHQNHNKQNKGEGESVIQSEKRVWGENIPKQPCLDQNLVLLWCKSQFKIVLQSLHEVYF